jgi:hypothetical protein
MVEQQSAAVYREVQRWSLGFRCSLLVLCLLGAAGGVVSTVVIATQDIRQWASLLLVAFCSILIPIGIVQSSVHGSILNESPFESSPPGPVTQSQACLASSRLGVKRLSGG